MRFQCFLLLLFLLPSFAIAQYNSGLGRFRLDEKKGCAPLRVNITHLLPGQCTPGGAPCDLTWGDEESTTQDSTGHTYINPGTYILSIQYRSGLNPGVDTIHVTVTPNTQPDFDIYTCNGREVQVKVTDTDYDSYLVYYGDGTADVPVLPGATDEHLYAVAGPDTIFVRGKNANAADNCKPPAFKTVMVINGALTAPIINLLTVTSGTEIDLSFPGVSNNTLYRVEIAKNTSAAASFQLNQIIHDVNTATVTNSTIRTDDNYYCLRLGAFDPCNNTTVYPADIICSANFDVTAESNQNRLTWITNAIGGTDYFSIDRDGTILTPATSPFIDPSICKTDSCYQITTNYANGSQSISLQKCVTAFSSDIPTAIENVTAIVGSGSVDLTWQQDPAFQPVEYSVFRKSGSGNYSLLSKTVPALSTDTNYATSAEFCYRINYIDLCDNISATGIDVCPIRLINPVVSNNSITLNWSNYMGWVNDVDDYLVEKYDAQGQLMQSFPVPGTTMLDNINDPNNQMYRYIVKANANDPGLGQSISNEIIFIQEPKLKYPTAFTPDKQGKVENETFKVFGKKEYIAQFEMNIFNRWGELLFTTNSPDAGWDGNYRGKEQPEGTYVFTSTITDLAGRTFKHSGSVVLLRKK